MGPESSIKALLIAFSEDPAAAIYSINRLRPEMLCFFLPETAKPLVESAIQPRIHQMPRRWDWVTTSDSHHFMICYQALAQALPDMLRTWEIQLGELVLDLTGCTPAMGAALMLAGVPCSSRVVSIRRALSATEATPKAETIDIDGQPHLWLQGNPWDEAAAQARHEAAEQFNRGAFGTAVMLFHQIEMRVSGGQKPLYRAFADMAEGYRLWDRFLHRQAWDKLKAAAKALDMAALWGAPAGVKALLPVLKSNAGFLERLVLDAQEVKEFLIYDLLAHARRRVEVDHHVEAALIVLLRALEAFAQWHLFKDFRIKTWDVHPEQLPEALREVCRGCYLDDIDGKYKLPMQSQFRALAGLGHSAGQAYLANWTKLKPLLDAAAQAVLGHGFEPVKPERFHQLYDQVMKLTGINDSSLPKFPVLHL
jgi:CRISPR-associated protein (TIGR02710 family)